MAANPTSRFHKPKRPTHTKRTREKYRNEDIVKRYVAGTATQESLADEYDISRLRVWQILRRAGVVGTANGKPRQTHNSMGNKTGRTAFIGGYVHPNVKTAIEELAVDDNSVSSLISEFVIEGLERRGITVDTSLPKDDREVPLPLEGKGNN